MQALLEKSPVVNQTELAAATIEAVTDLLKAAASTPPPLAAPQPVLTEADYCLPVPVEYGSWSKATWQHQASKAYPLMPVTMAQLHGDTPSEALVEAAAGWCGKRGLIGVPGTGEPDVDVEFPAAGPISLAEIADFLDWSAERIIRVGWVQGTEQYNDFVCSIGALRLRQNQLAPRMGVGRASGLAERACSVLTNHLHRHKGNMGGIIGWNDTTGRTMGEVVTAFREAAAELRDISAPRIRRAVLA